MSLDLWLAMTALFGIGGLTPGPAVMLVLASSFRYGFWPAMRAALGIAAANVIWLLLAVSGAAALLIRFPNLLTGMKVVGILVIFYLALSILFGPLPNTDKVDGGDGGNALANADLPKPRLFSRGVALQLSSPLPLVYFGLLLPTYIDQARAILPQFSIMLVTVTVTELTGLAAYAYGAQSIARWLHSPKLARSFNVVIALVMILSGLWAILA